MKKNISYVVISAISLILLCQVSCKKDDTGNATYPISGLWIGTYTGGGVTTPRFYSLTVFPDGSVLTKGDISTGFAYSQGTWTLTGNNFSATITTFSSPSVEQKITATFSNTGTLSGATWQDLVNPGGSLLSGDFQNLQRVN